MCQTREASGVVWFCALQMNSRTSMCDMPIWARSTGIKANGAMVMETFTMKIISGGALWLGVLDNTSGTTVHCPILYLTVKWNPCNHIVQWMRWEDGFGCWKSHVRATWSVTTSEGRPSKYGRDFFSDFSAPLSNRDSQAITCSSSTVSCVRRAHKPRSLASVYILKGLLKSGVINTVACTRSYLMMSNACWHCSIQIQVAFFFLVVQLSLKSGELMWYQPPILRTFGRP